jgi:hypothetical protein
MGTEGSKPCTAFAAWTLGVSLTIVTACGLPKGDEPLVPAPLSPPVRPAPVVAGDPELVLQRLIARDGKGAVDDSGSIVLWYGPEAVLVNSATGAVLARHAYCITDAKFVPGTPELVVQRCPEAPVPFADYGRRAPDVDIEVWNADTGARRKLSTGAVTSLDVGKAAAVIEERGRARVFSIADGRELAAFSAPGFARVQVSLDFSRALATDEERGRALLLLSGQKPKELDPTNTAELLRGKLSPDLKSYAVVGANNEVLVRDMEGRVLWRWAAVPTAEVVAFDPTGQTIAVERDRKGPRENRTLDIVGPSGVVCSIDFNTESYSSRGAHSSWGLDGKSLAIASADKYRLVRTSDCSILYETPRVFQAPAVLDFSLARVFRSEEGIEVVSLRNRVARTIPLKKNPMFDGVPFAVRRSGNLEFEIDDPFVLAGLGVHESDGQRLTLDALTLKYSVRKPQPLTLGGKTVAMRMRDGTLQPLSRGRQPLEAAGELVLVDQTKRTIALNASQGYAASYTRACEVDPGGKYLNCVRMEEDGVSSWVAVWDGSGKRLFERKGRFVIFGPTGERAVVLQDAEGPVRDGYSQLVYSGELVETRSGRALSRAPVERVMPAFDPAGALIAWNGRGVVDATTGTLLWKAEHLTPFFGSPVRVGVIRKDLREPLWMRAQEDVSPPFGPFDVFQVRPKASIGAREGDVAIDDVSDDGSVILTRDLAGVFRVRDAEGLQERAKIAGYQWARLSGDGRFVFMVGLQSIVAVRVVDGARLDLVLPTELGGHGMAVDSSGSFEADPEWHGEIQYRIGGGTTGRLVPVSDIEPTRARPGLVAEFFAEKPVP